MKQSINGRPVPCDLPHDKLFELLSSSDMMDFTVACEALSCVGTEEACDKLGEYLCGKDIYRRICVLKVIYRNPYATKYFDEVERAIGSDNALVAGTGLSVYQNLQTDLPDDIIIAAVDKHFAKLSTQLSVLCRLSGNENNYNVLLFFLARCDTFLKKEIIAQVLCENYLPCKARDLFELFSVCDNPKVRRMAVEIGKKHNFDITKFYDDKDGHVRKAAKGT